MSMVCEGGEDNWGLNSRRGDGEDSHCWEIARRNPVQLSLTPVLFSNAGGGILIEKPEKYRVEEITKRWIAKKKKRWIAYCF